MTLNISEVNSFEIEPMLLVDTTGSMTEPAADGSRKQRLAVVGEAIDGIVTALAAKDSQGEHEEGGGGVYTVTYAGGHADDYGDVNLSNLQHFFDTRRWNYNTQIMPGFNAIWAHYTKEFLSGENTDPPKLLLSILTDGELEDEPQFEQALVRHANDMFVVIGLVGFGRAHDTALAAYKNLAAQYSNIAVFSFDGVVNGQVIADKLLSMIL